VIGVAVAIPSWVLVSLRSMEGWEGSAITAVAVLCSSALTAWISFRVAVSAREDSARGELAAALAAYGHALDRLEIEIAQLPPAAGRVTEVTQTAVERWLPWFDWLLARIARFAVGREAYRALEAHSAAANRVVLVAPPPVLERVERISELLAQVERRDDRWKSEWRDARGALLAAAREGDARALAAQLALT
jgi:hypothetical protein